MTIRNLSPQQMFIALAREHRPLYRFEGETRESFIDWKQTALPKVLATLGDFPAPVPSNPQLLAEWVDGGLRRQRWIIDVQPYLSATLLVNIPQELTETEKRPAILCCHGHGPFGKEPVMGNASSPELRQEIDQHHYNYGEMMAQKGFVTYAIDWIGFGERNDNCKPNHSGLGVGRDWCNLYYLHATMLGMTSLSINVAHGKAATDFVCTLPFVDANRLGVMGLSGGGTMTLWMTLCDERFKATEIICYSDLWAAFGIRDINYCGMQVAPGLYKLVDLPDLQGLVAPRPLLIDIGANDTCFKVDTAMLCYQHLAAIYNAADAADFLELDLHPGEHGWGGNRSEIFFKRHLMAEF
ncbi:MAG: prolyl oligopeptidase family serine peptidase [Anaerolineae bacterium]|nr:prolyl oligopeptidase family serine peptidase [Anaerolineae bacterium]